MPNTAPWCGQGVERKAAPAKTKQAVSNPGTRERQGSHSTQRTRQNARDKGIRGFSGLTERGFIRPAALNWARDAIRRLKRPAYSRFRPFVAKAG